jgi:ATP-binding cassette subfamily B protein
MKQREIAKPDPEASAPSGTVGRLRRLHAAVRFALPQRHAIIVIVVLVLAVAGINAFEPLVLKWVFDQ